MQELTEACSVQPVWIILSSAGEEKLIRNVALLTLIPFTVAFAFIVFVLYRERREASFRENTAEMKRKIAEVEMKALRAQMNPHFLFNCLNSINNYITSNHPDEASAYLVKFSSLMRTVLENSIHKVVTLGEELKALDLYIQMEQMRLNNRFDYKIELDEQVDAGQVMVPPLILQPFVENSIWHGLSKKESGGFLSIFIKLEGHMVRFELTDNGMLAQADTPPDSKKKSLGMSLTKERLQILNATSSRKAILNVTELADSNGSYAGRKVELLLPFEKDE